LLAASQIIVYLLFPHSVLGVVSLAGMDAPDGSDLSQLLSERDLLRDQLRQAAEAGQFLLATNAGLEEELARLNASIVELRGQVSQLSLENKSASKPRASCLSPNRLTITLNSHCSSDDELDDHDRGLSPERTNANARRGSTAAASQLFKRLSRVSFVGPVHTGDSPEEVYKALQQPTHACFCVRLVFDEGQESHVYDNC
jgi:hypothetical protein